MDSDFVFILEGMPIPRLMPVFLQCQSRYVMISVGFLNERNTLLDTDPSWWPRHRQPGCPSCSSRPPPPTTGIKARQPPGDGGEWYCSFHTITTFTHSVAFPADRAGILALFRPFYFWAHGNVKLQKMYRETLGFHNHLKCLFTSQTGVVRTAWAWDYQKLHRGWSEVVPTGLYPATYSLQHILYFRNPPFCAEFGSLI